MKQKMVPVLFGNRNQCDYSTKPSCDFPSVVTNDELSSRMETYRTQIEKGIKYEQKQISSQRERSKEEFEINRIRAVFLRTWNKLYFMDNYNLRAKISSQNTKNDTFKRKIIRSKHLRSAQNLTCKNVRLLREIYICSRCRRL